MRYTFEEEFRLDHPEMVGETDRHFDLDNYKDWLEAQLIETRKQLALYNVVGRSEQLLAWERWKVEKGNYPEYRTQEQMINDYLSQ